MANTPEKPDLDDDKYALPLGGTRAQALHRLQVGVSLLLGIVLIVGLASVIEQRAKQAEDASVPQAAATVEPTAPASSAVDPLADAGVVPDMPATANPVPTAGPSAAGSGSPQRSGTDGP
jgi:hypothetical protein